MKKFVFISIIISAVLCSCDETFLDQDKPLVSTEAVIYTDAGKTEMALLGLYTSLKGSNCDFMGGKTYIAFDALGEDLMDLDPNGVTLFNTYIIQVLPSTTENGLAWYYAYLAINRANVFIESMEEYNTADVIGSDLAKQYVAEAKFIRALSYYYLVQLYSQPYKLNKSAKAIPLRLTAIKENGQSNLPCSTNAKIYETILNDLSDSEIAALPGNAAIKTRATKAAALMLKMRVYMNMENWQAAISAGEAISGYELVDDVAAQFATPYYTNESIFSIAQSLSDRPNTQRSPWEYYNTGRIFVIDKVGGVMSLPNYSLEDDKRVEAFDDNGILRKFPSSDRLNWIPVFRFAETKLNLAECYAQTSGKEADARTALAAVRNRSVDPTDDPLNISGLSGTALLEAISNEKRLEFIGEGMRGLDILRKGESFVKAGSPISGPINVASQSPFYIWPIPEDERVNNSLWNELEP